MEKITVNNWSLVKPEKLEGHWITGEEIGRHLGYSEPRISISTLYNRYKESFQEGLDCSVINLITEAGARDMRVFSRRGVLKVIRHSNTAVADKVMDEVFDVYLAVRAKAKAQAASSMALFPTPEQEATSIMSAWLKAAALLEVPKYYAQAEAVKATHIKTGIDYSPLLLKAPAQDNVPEAEMYLEPTEIGELLGFKGKGKRKGAEVNKFLGEQGFQAKKGTVWKATDAGKPHSQIHAWKSDKKTGFNLKWNVEFVRALREKKQAKKLADDLAAAEEKAKAD